MGKIIKNQGNKGFTTMFNDHFHDKRLSWGAKGMLSNVFSLPDNWEFSIKGFQAMSSDGERVVRSCLFELEWFGYLQRIQIKNIKGKILDYDYEFFNESQFPTKTEKVPTWSERKAFQFVKTRVIDDKTGEVLEEKPFLQVENSIENPERQNVVVDENPERQNVELGFVELQNADMEFVGQLNTNKLNTNNINNVSNQSINPNEAEEPKLPSPSPKEKKIDRVIDMKLIKEIKEQIEYESLIQGSSFCEQRINAGDLDIVVDILATLKTANKPMQFGDSVYQPDFIRARADQISEKHIGYVFDCFYENHEEVRNIKKYLTTAVFNSPATYGSFYSNRARAAGLIW